MKKGVILELKDQYTYILCSNGKMKKIKREYFHEVGQEIEISSFQFKKGISLALVTCIVILAFIFYPKNQIEAYAMSYVSLSVNPGIVFKVDQDYNVSGVTYTNQEGSEIVQQNDFVNQTLNDSIIAFIEYCFNHNYFNDNNEININVMSDDENQIQNIESQVKNIINDYMSHHQITITLYLDQTTDTQQEEAEKLGISNSKLKLINLVLKYYPNFNKIKLSHMDVDDLIDLLEHCGEDEELLDYLEDDIEHYYEKDIDHDYHEEYEDHVDYEEYHKKQEYEKYKEYDNENHDYSHDHEEYDDYDDYHEEKDDD